jgi:SWI/SNF-related matrix-associated actin-dependent regulator 1 of chromatin subfamily A
LWLADRLVALLAADMGLGKTGMAIRAADRIGARRILVICPAVARINWMREFGLWQTVRRTVGIIHQSKDRPQTDVVICNYDKLSRGSVSDLLTQDWDVVIADESHALKSPNAKRVKVVYGNLYGPADGSRQGGVVSRAKRTWLLTATPVPNHAGEIWTHIRALAPMLLPLAPNGRPLNYNQFLERYCILADTPFGQKIVGNRKSMLPELRGMLDGFMLRMRKTDVLADLPPLRFATTVIEADQVDPDLRRLEGHPEIRDLTATLEAARASAELPGAVGRDEKSDLLETINNRPGHITTLRRMTGLVKVQPALELLADELGTGALDKVVVFAVHRETIEKLAAGLAGFGAVQLHGGTSPKDRQLAIDGFQADPKIRVFVGQVTAAGTAITLTAADNVVFVEASWVPAENAQAAARCHRIGTVRPVLARFLALAGSVDELVQEALARKTAAINQIVETQ